MGSDLEQWIQDHRRLFIRQLKEWPKILIDWEAVNHYEVLDERKMKIGNVIENATGLGALMARMFLRARRPFSAHIRDNQGQILLRVERPFFWFFSTLHVLDRDHRILGTVDRKFSLFYKVYELKNAAGTPTGRIKSPFWRLWTFPLVGSDAVVTKKWGGLLKEGFTDADTYQVDFGSVPQDWEDKAVLLGAALSIDFDFFEDNVRR